MSNGLEDLPEPVELHRVFAAHHALTWDDPIPAKDELAAQVGVLATRRALEQLAAIGWRDAAATRDMLALVQGGAELYRLDKRIKSPQSLARKIKKFTGKRQQAPVIEDVQRYTVVTSIHDQLLEVTRRSAAELQDLGWQFTAVRNSYVDGSRYKGIHLNTLDPRGQRIEIQVQSTVSLAVKEATTRPYEIARNDELPRSVREQARAECIRLSDNLPTPRGLDDLTELAGCPVNVQGYGHHRGPRRPRGSRGASGTDVARGIDQARTGRRGREL